MIRYVLLPLLILTACSAAHGDPNYTSTFCDAGFTLSDDHKIAFCPIEPPEPIVWGSPMLCTSGTNGECIVLSDAGVSMGDGVYWRNTPGAVRW